MREREITIARVRKPMDHVRCENGAFCFLELFLRAIMAIFYTFSVVGLPNRPVGLNTIKRIRIEKTTVLDHC